MRIHCFWVVPLGGTQSVEGQNNNKSNTKQLFYEVDELNIPTQKFNFFVMFRDGFKAMTLGRTLWLLVIIKLIVMFLILKPVFFPNFLNSRFDNTKDKSDYVIEELVRKSGE